MAGCKAQASGPGLPQRQACCPALQGGWRRGWGGGDFWPPQVVGVVASLLDLGLPLFRPYLALLAPCGSCLLYRGSCRYRQAISLLCFVAFCRL